ncbi:hypothetical protein B4113_2982 [Geobacillus sp. B4113_201601]|nr:hypothetical protein B4113_2982 [Geobacillus sp. B4113_201601]
MAGVKKEEGSVPVPPPMFVGERKGQDGQEVSSGESSRPLLPSPSAFNTDGCKEKTLTKIETKRIILFVALR